MKSVLAAVLIAAAAILVQGCGDDDSSDDSATSGSDRVATSTTTTSTTPALAPPRPEEFKVDIIVIDKQCFGSAGCAVQYRIQPTYLGTSRDDTWTVIYEVSGPEEGPQVKNFDIDFSTLQVTTREERASTPSSGTELVATVTSVLPN